MKTFFFQNRKLRNYLILFISIISSALSFAQGAPTDILLNREAKFFDREKISLDLMQSMGKLKPLPFTDAVAEACYGVDICASLTSDSDINTSCDGANDNIMYGDACHVKMLRNEYSCLPSNSTDIVRSNLYFLRTTEMMLRDLSSLFTNQVKETLLDGISDYTIKEYNIDFKKIAYDDVKREEFFSKFPEMKTWFYSLFETSFGLGVYTGNCYYNLNQILFSNDTNKMIRYFNLYRSISDTLEMFPKNYAKVNRGVQLPLNVLSEHHKVGNIVCYNGFTSTSIHDESTDRGDKPRNYFLMGKCHQRLYIDTVDNGAVPGKLISKVSMSSSENEVLFEPGACFRIDKVYPRTDNDGVDEPGECLEGERYNFEMTLVPNSN